MNPQDPHQTQPGWPQNPAPVPQHGPGPRQPWSTRRKVLTWIGGGFGALILASIIASAVGGGTKTVAEPGPTVTVTQTVAATAQATRTASAPTPTPTPTQAPPKLTARTVATFSGSGQQNTPKFTVTGTWKLKYSFDCSSFGYKGNFQVYEDGGFTGLTVNDLGMTKSASTYAYNDAGTHYLQINSECSWSVKVIDEPAA